MPESWVLEGPLASVDDARSATPTDLAAAAVGLLDRADGVATGERSRRLRRATRDGPVVVGRVRLDRDRVRARLAMSVPDAPAELVLRTLAASDAIGSTADRTTASATVGGSPVPVRVEPDRDRLVVDLGEPRPEGVVLGLDLDYAVPDVDDLSRAGGPGSYGLLADHGGVVTLGHWLPAAVAVPGNAGAVPDWGDLGAFDAGTWVVDVDVPSGTVRTGGVDRTTPGGSHRAIGVGLRDLAAAWFPDGAAPATAPVPAGSPARGSVTSTASPSAPTPTTSAPPARDGTAPVVVATSAGGVSDAEMAALAADQLAVLDTIGGGTPWTEFDVVRAPIRGAAGMEFPGLVVEAEDYWEPDDPGTRFVLAHELGHQYAHALVGNGSLSDPVVDEPLAQYLAYRWFLADEGPEVADEFARRTFGDELDMVREAPGQPAADFASGQAYSVAIYRTAADAWYRAGVDHGVEVVDAAVRAVVDEHALREVDEAGLLESIEAVSPAVAEDLGDAFDHPPS